MDSGRPSEKFNLKLHSGIACALALAICLGALPALAMQGEQDQEDGQDQAAQPAQQAPGDSSSSAPEQSAPAEYQPLPSSLTLPAGTLVTVRVSQFLSSDRNVPGDTFNAELKQPLVVDGWVVARRGQSVLGRVDVAQKAGRIKGVSQLGVELTKLVLVDGQQLHIHTQMEQNSAGTSRERDARVVGTTTGIGAVVGAASGEGEGAGIGAGAGAAAGLASVLLTRGRATEIPPETVLTFQLQSPLTFSTERSRPAFRPVNQADYDNQGTLRRRPRLAAGRRYPRANYYGYGSPWGYGYPGSLFFGYYGFGRGYGRGFGRGGYRR